MTLRSVPFVPGGRVDAPIPAPDDSVAPAGPAPAGGIAQRGAFAAGGASPDGRTLDMPHRRHAAPAPVARARPH